MRTRWPKISSGDCTGRYWLRFCSKWAGVTGRDPDALLRSPGSRVPCEPLSTGTCTFFVGNRRDRRRRHPRRSNCLRTRQRHEYDEREQPEHSCGVVDEADARGLLRVAARRAYRVVDEPQAGARGVEVVRPLIARKALDLHLIELVHPEAASAEATPLRARHVNLMTNIWYKFSVTGGRELHAALRHVIHRPFAISFAENFW